MNANPLSSKITKLMSSSLDDPKLRTSLVALSEFYTVNAINARHNLRGDIERKGMQVNYEFLNELEKVNNQFLALEKELKFMNTSCTEMQTKLNDANDKTSTLLEQTDALREQSRICKVRQTIMEAFLDRFTLSDSEITILCSTYTDISPQFFQALEHLEAIHTDCDALLITEHQRAGLEIMDSMTRIRTISYDKLFNWMQNECRTMSRPDGMIEVKEVTKKAIQALKQRETLFRSILDELVHVRRRAVLTAFVEALTRGGPGGTPRPIELHAHDPQRYIGDMLAWIHQTVASEREFLESLLDREQQHHLQHLQHPSAPISRLLENDQTDAEIVLSLLDQNMEGTCRPLKTRVEQVLVSQDNAMTAFKISNLIKFYTLTITKAIGSEATLSKALQDILEASNHVFFQAIEKQSAAILKRPENPVGTDLGPPRALKEAVTQLKEIMKSFDGSFIPVNQQGEKKDVKDDNEEEDTTGEKAFSKILNAVIEPLFQMCAMGASQLDTFKKAVYMMNCLHYVQTALVYPFTKKRVTELEVQIQEYVQMVVEEEHHVLLQQSGILPLIQSLDLKDESTPLSLVPQMDGQSISIVLSGMDQFLGSVNLDLTFALSKIVSSRLAKQTRQMNVDLFVETYRRLCKAIEDPKNRYEFPASLLVRTAEDVEMFLE